MNLAEALVFSREKQSTGFKPDGCTFAPELGITKFCDMHDALRVFEPVSPERADELFFEGIKSKGARYLPVAYAYWWGVRFQHKVGGTLNAVVILGFVAFVSTIGVLAYHAN